MATIDSNRIKELRQANLWLRDFNLSNEDIEQIVILITRVLIATDTLEVFHQKILNLIKKDPETLKKLIAAVISNRFYPHREEISGFAEFVQKIGWQAPAPVVAKETPESFVGKILSQARISFPDHVEQSRLEFILNSFVKKERTLDEVKAALARPKKVGGMELESDEIDQIVNLFVEKIKNAVLEAPEPKPQVMTDIKLPPVRPTPIISFNDEKPVLPQPPPLTPPPRLGGEKLSVEEVVKQLEQKADLKFDESTHKKFVGAVEARFKDVRDAFETRDLLERPVDQGGLAINGVQLALIMEELEKIVGEQQTVARLKSDEDKKNAKIAAKVQAEKKSVAKVQPTKLKPFPPKLVTPVASPASRTLPSSNGRQIMVDVVPPLRRLSGPVDELQNLSLEEFRRLSSDPKEAIIKIHDKINLLEEQGIGQKILAVKAWRSSPINLLYLEISRAALLSGRTTEDVTGERLLANQQSLTKEEIQAINSLNGMLRF